LSGITIELFEPLGPSRSSGGSRTAVGEAILFLDANLKGLKATLDELKAAFDAIRPYALGALAKQVGADFEALKSTFSEFFSSASGLFSDLGPIVKDVAELSFNPLLKVLSDIAEEFGIVTPKTIELKDAMKLLLDATSRIRNSLRSGNKLFHIDCKV
jgi:phage-related protein